MISKGNYELAVYVIGRLMDEDPDPKSEPGVLLQELAMACKEYESSMAFNIKEEE